MGGRGGSSGTGGTAGGRQVLRAMGGGSSGVADAVYDEIENHMGRQYKREYAEGLAQRGTGAIHFPDMMNYITRNAGVSDKMPEPKSGKAYQNVVRDAFGKQAFDAIDKGMREGAQRWLDDHPRRRRRRS